MSRTKCKTVWKYNNNLTLEHFQTEFISSITLQDAEVAAASGYHQNCLEAMSCVKTIEVIFEESRCRKIYFVLLSIRSCVIYNR